MISMSIRMIGLALMFVVSGCGTDLELPPAGSAALEPTVFFAGRTHGDGELNKLFSRPVKVSVDSVGRMQDDTLILDQTIREGDKPPRVRHWTMRRVVQNVYSGTLTEAIGPVRVTLAGAHADIRYTMKGGLHVKQQLALQTDGKTVLNRLEVMKFGAPVATLTETIRKLD